MATEFQQHEVAKLIGDGKLMINDGYRAKNSELSRTGIPFARAGNIDGGFHFEDADRVPAETLVKVGQKKSRAGDVVFTSKGTVGRFAFVREHTPEFIYSPQLCFWRSLDGSCIDQRWLFYWMNGREFYLQFKGVAGQTDMAEYVSLRDQRVMKMTLPPLAEQKRIAEVLGALDDKIELNRRMNATLEATARALFQSWFVDFDPVRAKLDGCTPSGMDGATAALFPDSFEESSLGHIPKGWKAGKLGKFIQVGIGGAWGEEAPNSKQTVGVRCLRGIDCHDLAERKLPEVPIRYISSLQFEDRRLFEGCILVEGSGSFCGRSMVWLSEFEQLVGSSVCYSNFCKRLDPLCTPSQALVCWMQLRAAYGTGELANFRTGTAFPNFDIHGALLGLDVVCPPEEICDQYMKFYRSWLRLDLVHQSRTLATLRDTLLPKLLSGELSVREAQRDGAEHVLPT